MIRVGKRIYNRDGTFVDPEFKGFTPIIVMTKCYKKWFPLSPYALTNERGQIMENIFQFSKVYAKIPARTCHYSRYDDRVIWKHGAEVHVDEKGNLTKEYKKWRKKGKNNKDPVRYPVGFNYRHKCLYAIRNLKNPVKLDYIESRKKIYLHQYIKMAKKTKEFKELQRRHKSGENLLIIEVDGPHQESMDYYKKKYDVPDDFIVDSTVLVNDKNMNILLNDPKHPFGHGYCLGWALLGKN